jgi:hypothetical protein
MLQIHKQKKSAPHFLPIVYNPLTVEVKSITARKSKGEPSINQECSPVAMAMSMTKERNKFVRSSGHQVLLTYLCILWFVYWSFKTTRRRK